MTPHPMDPNHPPETLPMQQIGETNIQSPGKARITVKETVFHHGSDYQSPSIESAFQRELETDEQPYGRRMTLGIEWQPIVTRDGWLQDTSMLCVSNEEGKFSQVNPTEQQKRDADNKIVEIGVYLLSGTVVPFSLILPRESCRFQPHDLSALRIRSRMANTRCQINLLPL